MNLGIKKFNIMDFSFSFHEGDRNGSMISKKSFEFWLPFQEDPILRPNEIQSLWHGEDVIESLHLVKTAFLYLNSDGEIAYESSAELENYFVAARLKKVPYMVVMDHYKSKYDIQIKNPFYIDLFYSPNFGTMLPKYHLFQKVSLSAIPETMILFRES